MNDKTQIPLTSEQSSILIRCGSAYCKAVETKFGCTAIFHNLEDFSGSTASNFSAPELKYFTQLKGGVKVSVWKDDLTRHKVEAVVNAANEQLNHGGGLALALSNAGGPMFQRSSEQIIKSQKNVPTGTAVLGDSGYLPCKKIIHAVGPHLSPNPFQGEVDKATPVLRKTIKSILDIVANEKIASVAIPAMSSGLFNFPRNHCADIIVHTIKQYDEFNAFQGRNVEINLVNNDDPSVKEMERACIQFLGMPTITGSYSGAVGGNQSMTYSSGKSLQLGNVTLNLKKGHIEKEEVDVIVNTIGIDLNLSSGVISNAILKKAGPKIQNEIYGKKKYTSKGEIFETKGHNLNCAKVFHTVCASRSTSGATKILSNVVFECLKKAASAYKSISFPAIGTGNLGFDKREVATIMMDTVVNFASKNPGTKLDINFVVFPEDTDMMQAFENKLNSIKGAHEFSEFPNTTRNSSAFDVKEAKRNETPTLEISGASNEAVRETKAWTMNMLLPKNGKITIMNNYVIYLGLKDHENLLSFQAMYDVQISVFFRNGNGGISITGEAASVSCVAFEVESMLSQAQNLFAKDEEKELLYSVVRWLCDDSLCSSDVSAALEKAYLTRNREVELPVYDIKVNFKNKCWINSYRKTGRVERRRLFKDYDPTDLSGLSFHTRLLADRKDCWDIEKKVLSCGLNLIRVEKIENAALQQIFELNRKRVNDKPKTLYQCVSAQFCDLVCRVGFQKDFAPPAEQKYGNGIYFSSELDNAVHKLWRKEEKEEYIYIIQAQVLIGKSTIGSLDLILPPVIGNDPLVRYDSLNDQRNTHVIFSGQQALPEYLIVCENDKSSSAASYKF